MGESWLLDIRRRPPAPQMVELCSAFVFSWKAECQRYRLALIPRIDYHLRRTVGDRGQGILLYPASQYSEELHCDSRIRDLLGGSSLEEGTFVLFHAEGFPEDKDDDKRAVCRLGAAPRWTLGRLLTILVLIQEQRVGEDEVGGEKRARGVSAVVDACKRGMRLESTGIERRNNQYDWEGRTKRLGVL